MTTTLKFDISKHISGDDIESIKFIINRFFDSGYECYLIGGSVRDLILNNNISDYDFTTNARPDETVNLFKKVIPTGIKHGTLTVLLNKRPFEITTYRSDGKYIDGRRPETVTFSDTLEEDVKRRDFTINGLVYDIRKDEIIDFTNGIDDLNKKIIRTIGDPEKRFREDGLRTYRACRFASKLGFDIEDNTFNAISKTLDIADKISAERIRDEFIKILKSDIPSVGIEFMRRSGLLSLVLPELDNGYGLSQNRYHIFDIYHHSINSCNSAPADKPLIRLAALLHDLGKVITRKMGPGGDYTFYNHEVVGARITANIMRRLKFSNEEISVVKNLVINHMFHYTDEWTDGAVRRFMRKVGLENLDDVFLLRLADRKGTGSREGLPEPIRRLKKRIDKIIQDENAITLKDLDINGHALIEIFDLKPGPVIGRVLNELLEIILDDPEKNNRENLISAAEQIIKDINSV